MEEKDGNIKKRLANKVKRVQEIDDDPNAVIIESKGERFKEYRRMYDGTDGGKSEVEFPVDLNFEVIDACNYSCGHCFRALDPGSGRVLPDADYRKIIDQFVEANQGLGGVNFGRGEPMMDKNLENKMAYAVEKGVMDILLTTNGVYLTEERSRKLIEAGLTKMHVSLDAVTQKTYDLMRGGNLKQVEENLMGFIRIRNEMGRKWPIVRVSFVVSDINKDEMEQFEERWKGHADYIDFQKLVELSRTQEMKDFETKPFWCSAPFRTVAVSAKGEITPCCSSLYTSHIVFGNIYEDDTIIDVFRSEKTEKLRESFRNLRDYHIVCKNCRGEPA